MSLILGNVEVFLNDGLMYSILALGYLISYSILDFPDLSVEGTILTGGVTFVGLAKNGVNPWIAMIAAFITGALFGMVTGLLHVKLKIRPLLCGIIVSTGLITINLIATELIAGDKLTTITYNGRRNDNIFNTFPGKLLSTDFYGINLQKMIVLLAVAVIVKIIIDLYLKTKNGLLLRATGSNAQYVSMLAKNPGNYKILGLAIGNGLAGLCGALIVQCRQSVTQTMGLGMIVVGLASVIIGMSLLSFIRIMKPTTKVIIGAILYQACLAVATILDVPTEYNKLIMAVLFALALVLSGTMTGKRRA